MQWSEMGVLAECGMRIRVNGWMRWLLSVSVFGVLASAQADERGRWSNLPPEQRQEMRDQMREHWRQMPPERREWAREHFHEQRERWQQLPPEQRQRLRDEMHEQRRYDERREFRRRERDDRW